MRKFTCLLIVFLCGFSGAYAQSFSVSGNVTDENNIPLLGVNVIVKGEARGTTTDFDGNFTIENISTGDVLEFSYLGFVAQEITVSNEQTINVQLLTDSEALDEVVVVGYGTQRKSNIVGSVSSVEVEEATAIPTTNVSEMLRGRAAGVQVNLASARPGGGSDITIRGNVSVAPGGNQPLIIVDGLPFDSLNDVAPDDIASIEILKDAASTAIYGSRASNGVILVTTKTGAEGITRINYNAYTTVQSLTKNFNLYDGSQFVDLRREANRNRFTGDYLRDENIFSEFELETIENEEYVNWEDLVLQDAMIQSHALSFSTGTEKTKIFSSVNYFTQDGIIPNSGFDRGTFKLNLEHQLTDKLTFNGIFNYQKSAQDRETGGLNFTTITPLAKPFDENGDLVKFYLGSANTAVNPLWDQRESVDESKTNLTDLNLNLTYDFAPSLSYTLNTYIRNRNIDRGIYRSSLHSAGDEGFNGIGVLINSWFQQVLIENIVNYNPELNEDHNLDITAVQAFDERQDEYTQIDKSGFTNDALQYNGNATTLLANPRNVSRRRLLSFLGRVRYSYLDRYLLEATARADGASVFAENNKWGYFPAVSFAWKAHQESFLRDVDAINELKVRLSYGATGNQGINPLESLGVANDAPYVFANESGNQTVGGSTPSERLPNPDLKWETTYTFNAGIDFRLFNNLFTGTVEYYKANTTDLLLDRRIAGTTGFSFIRFNVGELQNEGFEASLNSNFVNTENFRWTMGLIFSTNQNEIISLTGETDDEGNPIDIVSDGRRLSVGRPINNIWLPKYDGIYQEGDDIAGSGNPLAQPGDVRVVDQDGNGQIDDRDNVFTNTDPDWYGSITNTFNYKNFELFADIYIVEGATRLNSVLANGELWKGAINGIRTKYYTPEFPSTEYPRPKPDTHLHLFPFAVRDASYVRLRTLTLGYNLPNSALSQIGLDKVKIYATGNNLFTFTDFKSYSPEQDLFSDGGTSFPETRNITIGTNITF